MQHFYDGQIRRYLVQTIRLLSNFVVKLGDGRLIQVPVTYGDMDRQVANIIKDNSENKINGAPRIAVTIAQLEMDKERLADPTYVGKLSIRERAVENGEYTSTEGANYTVERLMPSPYKLTLKTDIWTSNTEQKLQILEQILMLFNPSLEIQTTDNYIDWTSLSVIYLDSIDFSSRQIPVGKDDNIDIASITFSMPIWISPPSKVKKLGIVTSIIMGMYSGMGDPAKGYLEGFAIDPNEGTRALLDQIKIPIVVNTLDYHLITYDGKAKIFSPTELGHLNLNLENTEIITNLQVSWDQIIDRYPNGYKAGESKIFLIQNSGYEVVGTFAIDPFDRSLIIINWDTDTYPSNTDIVSNYRVNSPGTFDAIVDPLNKGPDNGLPTNYVGLRYLLINNVGGGHRETIIADRMSNRIDTTIDFTQVRTIDLTVNNIPVLFNALDIDDKLVLQLHKDVDIDDVITYTISLNEDGPDAWKNNDSTNLIANANDIIEWDGNKWKVIFDSTGSKNIIRYLTNIFSNVQYKWDGVSWSKSFEGEYRKGFWRLIL